MSAHAFHAMCGCDACCAIEDADERQDEVDAADAAWAALDPLQQLAINRRTPRAPFYGRSRAKALGKSFGYALHDARAVRIQSEIELAAARSNFIAVCDSLLAEIGAVNGALRGAA